MIIVCACVCALIIAESQETSDAKCDPTTGLKVHSAKYVYAFIAYIRFRRGYDTIRYDTIRYDTILGVQSRF